MSHTAVTIGRSLMRASVATGLVCLACCGPTKVTTETSPFVEQYQIRTMAVLPFEILKTPQVLAEDTQNLHVPSGVKKSDISIAIPPSPIGPERATTTVQPMAAETVTRLVWDRLRTREELTVKSLDEARMAARELGLMQKSGVLSEAAPRVGKKLGVDGVVTGKVLVYQERVGSRLGADAATVGFEVTLMSVDGRILWMGNYYEKQRPMTEDLQGFIERRGAFVTAAELAAYGADKMMKHFPYGRKP